MEFERKISKGRNWLKKIFFFLVKQKKKRKEKIDCSMNEIWLRLFYTLSVKLISVNATE